MYAPAGCTQSAADIFYTQCNLIYLGLISRRIPIIPPFAPFDGHLGKNAPPLNFGEVYDLPRLRKAIQWPVLEWSDVKMARYNGSFNQNEPALDGVKNDVLGCWGVAAGEHPVWSALPDFLHLGMSWCDLNAVAFDYLTLSLK